MSVVSTSKGKSPCPARHRRVQGEGVEGRNVACRSTSSDNRVELGHDWMSLPSKKKILRLLTLATRAHWPPTALYPAFTFWAKVAKPGCNGNDAAVNPCNAGFCRAMEDGTSGASEMDEQVQDTTAHLVASRTER